MTSAIDLLHDSLREKTPFRVPLLPLGMKCISAILLAGALVVVGCSTNHYSPSGRLRVLKQESEILDREDQMMVERVLSGHGDVKIASFDRLAKAEIKIVSEKYRMAYPKYEDHFIFRDGSWRFAPERSSTIQSPELSAQKNPDQSAAMQRP